MGFKSPGFHARGGASPLAAPEYRALPAADRPDPGRLKKGDRDKILAFEMYCYRRMLHLSWTQKVKNVEIREILNIKEDLVCL